MKIYSVYDMAAGAYLAPFYEQNDLMAIRRFAMLVNDENSIFCKSAQDFTLHCLGEWDDSSGLVTQDEGPRPVRSALSLIERDLDERQIDAFEKFADNVQRSIGDKSNG